MSSATERVKVWGRTDERLYDFECDLVELHPSRATFRTRTQPPHAIEITPRYVGQSLEDADATRPDKGVICGFTFDGEYVALAVFYRLRAGVLVVPHDYSPGWVYEITQEEREQIDQELAELKRELDAQP